MEPLDPLDDLDGIDMQRMLSYIYNESRWEKWITRFYTVGDFGIPFGAEKMTPEEAIEYHRRIRRFPRNIFHWLADYCDDKNRAYHNKMAILPQNEWPNNRKV